MNSEQPTPQDSPVTPRQVDTFDLWMSRAVRIVGLTIAVFETVVEKADRPALLGTALVMMTGSFAYDALRRKLAA